MLLRRSFVHIPGIGPAREKKLWSQGIVDWEQLRRETRSELVLEHLDRSERALGCSDWHYFYRALPRAFLWRILPMLATRRRIAYLDIETTGMGMPPEAESTTITFYLDGKVYQEHERGAKLRLIQKVIDESDLLVTFFGEVFDVPFLEREFGVSMRKAHLDLCFWLKRHGYKGGLKKIQKQFREIPERDSMDIDGFDAVRLWRMHQRGVRGALETLLTYNAEDTIVLEPLLVEAFNLEVASHPEFGLERLPTPELPSLKTRVHADVYGMLRGAVAAPELR